MESEGSLPHSHVPAICPYPEPAQSSPYPHIPLPEDPSGVIIIIIIIIIINIIIIIVTLMIAHGS
jgi:hypothetical protein